jgi:hypothetical protein
MTLPRCNKTFFDAICELHDQTQRVMTVFLCWVSFMSSVMYAECCKKALCAECHYADCRGALLHRQMMTLSPLSSTSGVIHSMEFGIVSGLAVVFTLLLPPNSCCRPPTIWARWYKTFCGRTLRMFAMSYCAFVHGKPFPPNIMLR